MLLCRGVACRNQDIVTGINGIFATHADARRLKYSLLSTAAGGREAEATDCIDACASISFSFAEFSRVSVAANAHACRCAGVPRTRRRAQYWRCCC